MNGITKFVNWIILEELKKRLDSTKGGWGKKLPYVLWSYRMIVHTNTKETPFKITFDKDTIIPVEI